MPAATKRRTRCDTCPDKPPNVAATLFDGNEAVYVDNRPKDEPPTADEIAEYLELEEQRKEYNRQAEAIDKQNAAFRERLAEYVKEKASRRRSQSVTLAGYLIAIVDGKRNVRWKEAFINAMGAEAAAKVQEETPPSKVLEISRT